MYVLIFLVTVIFILLILSVHLIGKRNEEYWKKRGVVFWKKNRTLGVFWEYLTGKDPLFKIFDDIYKEYPDASAVALGTFTTPTIFLTNPDNIRHVTITDFQSFYDRGLEYNDNDILAHNVAFINGPKWKVLRQALSPLFTTAKLRNMHYIVDKCARDFVHFLKSNPDKCKGNAYATMNTYCCAALTAAVFGLGTGSTFQSPFIALVRKSLASTSWVNFKFAVSFLCPRLFHWLGLTMFSVQSDFFVNTISQLIRDRKKYVGGRKHDFGELCVNLQNSGMLRDHDTGYELEPTDEVMAAQAFFFYLAGLEPTAAGMFAVLFELGRDIDIQKRLQQDIDAAFEENHGELTYDAIVEITYLNKVVKEALRIYPPVATYTRECVRNTELPVGNIKIDKGTKVYIPVYSMHHNPDLFPDSMKFDPERFSRNLNFNDGYMPFGEGNRSCLGRKYALITLMSGVVHILRHFDIKSVMKKGRLNFKKEHMFVRLDDVDFDLIPRAKSETSGLF